MRNEELQWQVLRCSGHGRSIRDYVAKIDRTDGLLMTSSINNKDMARMLEGLPVSVETLVGYQHFKGSLLSRTFNMHEDRM